MFKLIEKKITFTAILTKKYQIQSTHLEFACWFKAAIFNLLSTHIWQFW